MTSFDDLLSGRRALQQWELDRRLNNFYARPYPTPWGDTPGPGISTDAVQGSLWDLGLGLFAGRFYETPEDYLIAASGTFSRASDATYFDADGILRTASSGDLRLDHDPETGDPLGFRAEGQRTNVVSRSDNFGTAWGSLNNCVVSNAGDGLWKLERGESATEGTASGVGRTNMNVTDPAGPRCYYADVRQGNTDRVALASKTIVLNFDTQRALFNLVELTISENSSRFDSAFIREHLNDDCRVGTIGTTTTGQFGDGSSLSILLARSNTTDAQVGDYVFVRRVQGENAAFPSSYIRTEGSTATRLADALTYAVAGSSEGAVVVRGRTPLGVTPDVSQVLWQWDDGTEDNRLRLVRDSDRDLHFIVTVEENDEVDLNLGTVADNTDFTVAVSWKEGEFHASLNGGTAVSNTEYEGSLPTVTTLREGSSSDGEEWFGTIARMFRYDKAYSAEQIEEMAS